MYICLKDTLPSSFRKDFEVRIRTSQVFGRCWNIKGAVQIFRYRAPNLWTSDQAAWSYRGKTSGHFLGHMVYKNPVVEFIV